MLKLVRMCKEGIVVSELKDAYPGVVEDIEVSLTSLHRLWLLYSEYLEGANDKVSWHEACGEASSLLVVIRYLLKANLTC